MSPFIIGIGHVARVGKSVAADGLCRDLGFQQFSFAEPLKQLAFEADPLVTSQTRMVNIGIGHGKLKWVVGGLGWEGAKDTYPEVRIFLQNLGLGARKVFGEDFWVDTLLAQIKRKNPDRVVIPDVRFENEAEAIKAAGGVVIRIDRPGYQAKGHQSETELQDYPFDKVVANATTVADLQAAVAEYVGELLKVKT